MMLEAPFPICLILKIDIVYLYVFAAHVMPNKMAAEEGERCKHMVKTAAARSCNCSSATSLNSSRPQVDDSLGDSHVAEVLEITSGQAGSGQGGKSKRSTRSKIS